MSEFEVPHMSRETICTTLYEHGPMTLKALMRRTGFPKSTFVYYLECLGWAKGRNLRHIPSSLTDGRIALAGMPPRSPRPADPTSDEWAQVRRRRPEGTMTWVVAR